MFTLSRWWCGWLQWYSDNLDSPYLAPRSHMIFHSLGFQQINFLFWDLTDCWLWNCKDSWFSSSSIICLVYFIWDVLSLSPVMFVHDKFARLEQEIHSFECNKLNSIELVVRFVVSCSMGLAVKAQAGNLNVIDSSGKILIVRPLLWCSWEKCWEYNHAQ